MLEERVNARVPKEYVDVVKKFKSFVLEKYGKKHTVYGLELAKAMAEYLERNNGSSENTPSTLTTSEPEKNYISVREKRLEYIYDNFTLMPFFRERFIKFCVSKFKVSRLTSISYFDQMCMDGRIRVYKHGMFGKRDKYILYKPELDEAIE